MGRIYKFFTVVMGLVFLFPTRGNALPPAADLPKIGGKPALARINGEPLLLEEFERALAGIHSVAPDNTARPMPKPSVLLERLINAKLVLQEARNIGLDALPEVRAAQKVFEEDTLRKMLYGYHVRNILTPDKKEVEKRYRDAVKEVKVISVLFDKEEDAKRVKAEAGVGGGFEGPAKKAVDAGEAKGSVDGQYLKSGSLSPEAAKAVFSMKKGDVSPVIRTGKQFYLLKLEDIRFPEDKAARVQAEQDALQAKRTEALKAYAKGLRKKYVTVDRKLFDTLDFDAAGTGIEKFRADERVLAAMKGETPVTVGDLTAALEKIFFHGAERAAGEKKVNLKKEQTLEEILNKRVALLEAKKRKLERTELFKGIAQENRNSVLFGTFVQKVVTPDVKVGDEELNGYYQAHINEYTYPEMVRIDGLVFAEESAAEVAIEKLRKGADFQWLRANADGQVEPAKEKTVLEFKGRLLAVTTLPDGVRNAMSGAAPGEYRLYAEPGNAYCVLALLERIPSRPVPLESVKGEVEKKAFSDILQRVLRDWEEKLRKASDVKIYATGRKLDGIVNPGAR
jgi:parvulin-like peptidyl-prolyl isomerase